MKPCEFGNRNAEWTSGVTGREKSIDCLWFRGDGSGAERIRLAEAGAKVLPHIRRGTSRSLGTGFGKSSGAVDYSDRPPYRAFVFSAFGGERSKSRSTGGERTAFVHLPIPPSPAGKRQTNISFSLPKHGPYIECW